MDSAKVRRNIVIKRLNEAHMCATRARDDVSYKPRFQTWLERLPELLQSFDEFHTKIVATIDESDQQQLKLEDDIQTSFDNKYSDILSIKIQLFNIPPTTEVVTVPKSENNTTLENRQVKLPKLSLKNFDGDYKQWLPFKDLYHRLVHTNESLSGVEKFSYLISALQGPPLKLVEAFPLSDANYEKAYQSLIDRYENKRQLAFLSWESIINAKLVANSAQSLRQLLDTFSENLAILKNLKLPIEQWDFVLFHALLTKLHPSIRKQFELKESEQDIPTYESLKKYVHQYCQAWERSSNNSTEQSQTVKPKAPVNIRPAYPRQTTLVANTRSTCPYCSEEHFISRCPKFQALSVQQRFNTTKSKRWCVNCLRANHTTQNCQSKTNCNTCSKRHHTLLHIAQRTEPSQSNADSSPEGHHDDVQPSINVLANTAKTQKTVLLSTAQVQVLDKWGNYQTIRILLDSGSQANFITNTCVQRLGLSRHQGNTTIYGLGNNDVSHSGKIHCTMRPQNNANLNITFEAIVLPKICNNLPSSKIPNNNWDSLKNISFADPTFNVPGPIDALVGAELWPSILQPGTIPGTNIAPMAINTIFGWVLMGSTSCINKPEMQSLMAVADQSLHLAVQRLWELENIPGERLPSPEDDLCEEVFLRTHTRNQDGRYMVDLPFNNELPSFTNMKEIALRRYYAIEKRLKQNPQLHQLYVDFMRDYLQSGHMSEVPTSHQNQIDAYYIPHHCVINENSTSTRLRVVFDASATDAEGKSLNHYQSAGPKLQTDLFDILLRFRIHNIVFTTDIRQMYRQILVNPKHRCYQRILWRFDPSEPISEYQLHTVTYGVSSSPFLALRVIKQLANDEHTNFPLAAEVLLRDTYVDDIPSGAESVEKALNLQRQLIDIMARGGFELRKWASNQPALLRNLPPEHCLSSPQTFDLNQDTFIKVLGLRWDPVHDNYLYQVQPLERQCTKRTILSELARTFDPLGFLSPLTFLAKLIVQKLWLQGVDWDERPPEEIINLWTQYTEQLPSLSQLIVPRQITHPQAVNYQLHGFGDASESGYGAAVYIRVELLDGSVQSQLICAKSRVAPIKRLTIPRLELCAATLLVDLMSSVLKSLSPLLTISTLFTWSDSMITLAWINSSPERWKTFVANRVSRIQRKLPNTTWRYVDTKSNPSDCVSRGLLPSQLLEHPIWFHGPEWLSQSESTWPSTSQAPSQPLDLPEQNERKIVLHSAEIPNHILPLLDKFSSLRKIQRIIVYIHRFIKSLRKQPHNCGAINAFEMQDALMCLAKLAQQQSFHNELILLKKGKLLPKPLRKLNPFLDDNSILRVGGRLQNAELTYEAKHPILLPNQHRLTTLLIEDTHFTNMHPGAQAVQFLICQNFWIVSARRAIKRCLHKCIRCFRVKPNTMQPIMAHLPIARVSGVKAFLNVGCDYAGPFNVIFGKRRRGARSQKVYLCLFVCFATKALHLEIASDLTTDAFIAALRRFIARRGRCIHIFSDCGTNFVGAYNQLRPLMKKAAEHEYIAFSTHPPSAPHFSGLAEAGVKSVKTHLHRVVGAQLLTHEEFQTLITQIEAALNSRPLSALSNDPNDLSVLTPGHFLTLSPLTTLPESDTPKLKLTDRWQLLQRLHNDFWQRWKHDYLQTLTQLPKWNQHRGTLALGDLVILKDDNSRPLYWRLGRIIQLHPGADGVNRVATVRTDNGTLKRPLVKLCLLPIEQN